jgi:hypothetical protein
MKRLGFLLLLLIGQRVAAGGDLQSQVQVLMKSPDASISGTYDLPARAPLVDGLLRAPLLVARLWEAYDFTPRYKVSMQGDAIHVDDPTGIQGNLYLVEQAPNRRVYYGTGALNHELVPAFRGRMALVLTMNPKGSGMSGRIDIYIRTESRFLGFFARTLFPLVRAHAEHRMNANVHDICTILNDVSTAPQQTAARLKNKEDAAALDKLITPPAQTKGTTQPKNTSAASPTKK